MSGTSKTPPSVAKTEPQITRVILWSSPRSASTALLKCMSGVPNAQLWLEPYLMIHHYSQFGKFRDEVIKFRRETWGKEWKFTNEDFGSTVAGGYMARDKTYSWVKGQLESNPPNISVIFSKEMARGLDGHFESLPEGYRHTFLIRHPYKVFSSWKRMINRGIEVDENKMNITDQPEYYLPEGFHYKELYDIYQHVKEHIDPSPVVIDCDDLLANPGRILQAYCGATGIPYSEDLLQWTPGRQCMDDVWQAAKEEIFSDLMGGMHKETFASTGFGKPSRCPDRCELDEDVLYCSDLCMKYYDEMHASRLEM